MSKPHLLGRPVSYATYRKHGCRCEGCTAAATQRARLDRQRNNYLSSRIENRALRRAGAWVRRVRPELWAEFREEAHRYFKEQEQAS